MNDLHAFFMRLSLVIGAMALLTVGMIYMTAVPEVQTQLALLMPD